jgi:hypothetical protein
MARTEELSDIQPGTVIGCHRSSKSVRQISTLLELPRSTVSGVIVKGKGLGATSAQPHKLTERDCRVLIVCPQWEHSLPSSKLTLEITSARELFVGSFKKWISVAVQPHTCLRSPSVGWSVVKLAAIRLWSSGNAFSGASQFFILFYLYLTRQVS